MEAKLEWIDQPKVFRVNQMPPHSDHCFYESEGAMRSGASAWKQMLNGKWQFKYSKRAKDRPVSFYKEDFDVSDFDKIEVPGHIELAGYDRINYVNIQYPWEGHEYLRPPYAVSSENQKKDAFSGSDYCPVGSYRRLFDLEEALWGKRVSLFFEGVEQAVFVWLNGTFIGYAEDSFTPTEFDLTKVVREKNNVLAVEVYKKTTAAYLEDQDFFRFFGIFRDVYLVARPQTHVEDLWLRPQYEPENGTGILLADVKISGEAEGELEFAVWNADGHCITKSNCQIEKQIHINLSMPDKVQPWSYTSPYLYRVVLTVKKADGAPVEYVPYEVGFRKIEIEDKIIKLNGERMVFCGVNRHEWSARSGRCIGGKEREWDMECFRRNHINAVRTSHYPNQIPWYYLCDKNGIYMIAETNLETHGSWGKEATLDPTWNVPGSVPEWEAMTLDRAKTHFEVLKNHTAILIWSLGNESYAGETICKMNDYYKAADPGRLVHYEGVYWCPEYKERVSDIESRMYAYPEHIREYLETEAKKPMIQCEYMHDMGNSMGGLNTYMKLIDEYEMYQGGFIWDFIDQSLLVTDEVTGKEVLRYGGDFDDRPADYEFSGDGLCFGNRIEKPAVQEVRYYYGKYAK